MATLKTGSWTPQETAKVANLPKDAKLRKKLIQISNQLKRPYANVYQKWHSEFKKAQVIPTSSRVIAMNIKFEEDFDGSRTSVTKNEIKALETGLEPLISKMEPGRGAALIPVRMKRFALAFALKIEPNREFRFHSIKDNQKFVRMMMKS